MADEKWQPARLIPTSGISGQEEAERRATSALLAVMASVREFGIAMTRPFGAPSSPLGTYIEVPFKVGESTVYPDGVLETTRAGKTWTALVEVKTGAAELERPQVETYLDVARENGFDAVLTISNQMAPAPGVHPLDVDRRKLRKVALHHLSWAEVLTIAVQQRVHQGVSDPDQAWILGELIRYLEHPRSGALDFSDMGGTWVAVREAVATGTLRPTDKGLADVVSRWEQLLRFAALRLGRELGADVQIQLSRKEVAEPSLRFAAQAQSLVTSGTLAGNLKIPGAIASISLVADVRAGRVVVAVDIDAPSEGRPATRVNWLVRQLRDAPDGLRIDAFMSGSRTSTSDLLRVVRENPAILVQDPKREFRSFRIAATSPIGTKRGTGRGAFIDSVLAALDGFYGGVVQQLRPWTAKAPQLPRSGKTAAEEAGIDIHPPHYDLVEPADSAPVSEAPPEAPLPETVLDGIAAARLDLREDDDSTTASGRGSEDDKIEHPEPPSEQRVGDELVTWEVAQSRLDHEREVSAGR
jgi:hypothetical protein